MPHRSPVIFWLLLAATICIDAVAMSWSYIAGLQRTEQLYVALVCGQLSASCVWAAFSLRPGYWRFSVPFAVAFAAALWACWPYDRGDTLTADEYFVAHAAFWATQAALLLGVLWILRQLAFWPGLVHGSRARRWQFSVGQLLVLMTVAAMIIALLSKAEFIRSDWMWISILLANHVGLSIAVVLIQTMEWRRVVRAAASAGGAIALGLVVMMIRRNYSFDVLPINLIQAFILFCWVEYGGLMPSRSSATSNALVRPTNSESGKSR